LEVAKKWTPEIEAKIEDLLKNKPKGDLDAKTFTHIKGRR